MVVQEPGSGTEQQRLSRKRQGWDTGPVKKRYKVEEVDRSSSSTTGDGRTSTSDGQSSSDEEESVSSRYSEPAQCLKEGPASDEEAAKVILSIKNTERNLNLNEPVDLTLSLAPPAGIQSPDACTSPPRTTSTASCAQQRIRKLFSKLLKKSDVKQLNRLVIPKQEAREHFPRLREATKEDETTTPEVIIACRDESGKLWEFKYKYWVSSKTYVFSTGWINFVREYKLLEGDEVTFRRDLRNDELLISFRRLTCPERDL